MAGSREGVILMALVPLKVYAEKHGRAPRSVRDMANRGSLKTAVKIGRDWLVDENEPYPDHRIKTGKYQKEKGEG